MSQAKLAERINRSEAALSRWETGKATPSAFDIREIARVFELPGNIVSVLIYPPAIYSPEMERVFDAIGEHLATAALSGVEEGRRRDLATLLREEKRKPARSPRRRPRGTGAERA